MIVHYGLLGIKIFNCIGLLGKRHDLLMGAGLTFFMLTIYKQETQVLNLSIIPWEETKFSAKLLLDLQDVGDSLASVSLKSECFSPKVWKKKYSIYCSVCYLLNDCWYNPVSGPFIIRITHLWRVPYKI